MNTIKTRKQYMNKEVSHHDYHAQFATEATRKFILNALTPEQIYKALKSGYEHLNQIKIPFNNMSHGGGWWWDNAPLNIELWRKANNKEKNIMPSLSTRTCVGKAMAKII